MSHDVVIAVGSNIRPQHYVPRGVARLQEVLADARQAKVYETAAIDRPGDPNYWNTAVRGTTPLDQDSLRTALRHIEQDLERRRTRDRYAARTIDLDETWRDGHITDPDVATRAFLQQCLRDVGIDLAFLVPLETSSP